MYLQHFRNVQIPIHGGVNVFFLSVDFLQLILIKNCK